MTRRAKCIWVFLLYFIEGLPFGVFNAVLPVYFRLQGMSLRDVGHLSILQLPWSLKVLWAPLVDRLGHPIRWVMGALVVLALVMLGLGSYHRGLGSTQVGIGALLTLLLLVLSGASATQDLAIDGYFIRLMKPEELAWANSVRVAAYRTAMITGGGGLVMLAGLMHSWQALFVGMAALFAALALILAQAPRLPAAVPADQPSSRAWFAALSHWYAQPRGAGVLAFVLLYKLGDTAMIAMVPPFWVDRGMSTQQIGTMTTVIGVVGTMVGAFLGGAFTHRAGLLRALWVLGLALAGGNLAYTAVAYLHGNALAIYAAATYESVTQGLGTAAQMVLLTRICDKRHAATQFALFTALTGLSRALAGKASGYGVDMLDYGGYFFVTFLLSFPAYLFYPAVRARLAHIEAGEAQQAATG